MAQKQSLIVNLGYQQVCLDLEEKLGQGAFGSVYRAVDNRGVSFAVKLVVCHDQDTYKSAEQEIKLLLQLKHPNIVSMYGFELVDSSAILIMEFCSHGTLNKRLDKPVEPTIQIQWMGQLTEALTYLHTSNIVHRDLKTENILLSDNDDVKIADFGISRPFLCCKRGTLINRNDILNEYLDSFMGTFAGTPFWIAPEVFDNHYDEKADIFSLGVIFYAICERQFITFQNEKYFGAFTNYRGNDTGIGLVMYECQEFIKPLFKQTCRFLQSLILSLLHFNPDERCSLINVQSAINEAFLQTLEIDEELQCVGGYDINNRKGKVPRTVSSKTNVKTRRSYKVIEPKKTKEVTKAVCMKTKETPRKITLSTTQKNCSKKDSLSNKESGVDEDLLRNLKIENLKGGTSKDDNSICIIKSGNLKTSVLSKDDKPKRIQKSNSSQGKIASKKVSIPIAPVNVRKKKILESEKGAEVSNNMNRTEKPAEKNMRGDKSTELVTGARKRVKNIVKVTDV